MGIVVREREANAILSGFVEPYTNPYYIQYVDRERLVAAARR